MRAHMSCSIKEERFIPYARAVAIVSYIIGQNNKGLNSAKEQGGQ